MLNNFLTTVQQCKQFLNSFQSTVQQLLNNVKQFYNNCRIFKTTVETMFNVQNNVWDLTVLAGIAEALIPFNV